MGVLVNIIAYRWNGEIISLDAQAVVDGESAVAVTLKQYQPQYLRNMTMFIAPLLSDSHFLPSWNATAGVEIVETQEARRVFEEKCHENALLQSRFNVCGNDLGWETKIAKTSLQPWQPDTTKISFRTEPLEEAPFFTSHKLLKLQRVTMMYENSSSPAFWSIPENQCEFHVLEVDEAEKLGISAADAQAATESALMALGSTPSALCIYISRKCDKIQMTSPIPMPDPEKLFRLRPQEVMVFSDENTEESRFKAINATAEEFALEYARDANSKAVVTSRPAHVFSSILAPLLQCYRARGPPWPNWVKPKSWQADLGGSDRVWSGWKMDPDAVVMRITGPYAAVEIKDVLQGMASSSSQIDEKLIKDMCDFLFKPANCRLRPAEMGDLDMIQETVMVGAFSTGNGDILGLVEKHCVKFKQISARNRASLVSVAWQRVKTDDNGLQLLNASLRSEDPDFARALVEFSTSSKCSECAGTVKDIFQQEGHSWPLNFQRFTLYMNENYETLLDTRGQNPTAPWICTEELWIRRPIGQYGPFHCDRSCARALRTFLHQFATCSTALTSLVIDLLSDAAGVEELIETLKSELPTVLDLSVVPDGAQKLVQKVPMLEELPNLHILKLRIRAKSMNSYAGDKVKVVEFAKDLIQKAPTKLTEVELQVDSFGFRGDGEAPTAMANMIGALPSLKRFRVGRSSDNTFTYIDGDKPALSSFIAAVAADASSSKLESFSFRCPDAGGLPEEYERFGKALASMPELQEIDMTGCRWKKADRDPFLQHFITKTPATLRKLLLKLAWLTDHDLQTVSKIIEKQPLEVIDISNNDDVFDQGLHHISQALSNLQKLTPAAACHLREVYALELSEVTDSGIQELFQSLQNCRNLTLVDVSKSAVSQRSDLTGLSKETIEMAMKARRSSWPNITRLVVTYMKREYNLVEVDPL